MIEHIRPRIRIALSVPCTAWLRRMPDLRARCRRVARAALLAGGAQRRFANQTTAELSLVLGDDDLLRRLNREYRRQDKPTNVLSFAALEVTAPARGPITPLGDVVIAYQTTDREAREQGKTLPAHLSHLVVHGVLHLLGYDHGSDKQAKDMETLETAVLARFGLSDPYRARAARKTAAASRSQPRIARARR